MSTDEQLQQRMRFKEIFDSFVSQGIDPNIAAVKTLEVFSKNQGKEIISGMSTESQVQATTHDKDAIMTTAIPEKKEEITLDNDSFSLATLKEIIDECAKAENNRLLIRRIGTVFSDPEKLVKYFVQNEVPQLDQIHEIFEVIEEVAFSDESVGQALRNALLSLSSTVKTPFTNNSWEQIWPILLSFEFQPFEYDPDLITTVSNLFFAVTNLSHDARSHFVKYFENTSPEYYTRILGMVQMFVTLKVSLAPVLTCFDRLREGVFMLSLLYQVNTTRRFVDYKEFYNSAVNQLAVENEDFLYRDVEVWFGEHHDRSTLAFVRDSVFQKAFCDYPFILDTGSKALVLQLESQIQKQHRVHGILRQNPFVGRAVAYLIFRVHRDNLVEDVLDIVAGCSSDDFKKPLRVHFEGEEGVDEGGVRKEFFLLMVRQLLDRSFGMFQVDDVSGNLWFNPSTFETAMKFELVGIILGLAIYNTVILDINFPRALYAKLLGLTPTFDDFEELNPRVAKSLRELLAFDGDVESVFCSNFEISYEYLGDVKTFDLKENGSNIPVTKENREEYVQLYVNHFLNVSVDPLFRAFQKGFLAVCQGTFIEVFHPEEFELLLIGSTSLNFDELEKSCRYDGGYEKTSPTIVHFWRVVHGLSPELQRKFLMFTTGSDRVPIRGLVSLNFTISRHGPDSDRLPTAHTCFNHLLLPDYDTEQKLKERLMLAICHSEGFGTL